MEVFVSVTLYIVCLAVGWGLGRTEGRPYRGLLYAVLGPLGLILFWVGRDWRRERDARKAAAGSH